MRIKRHQKVILLGLAIGAVISLAACSSTAQLPKLAGDAVIEETLSSILADNTFKSDLIHPNAAGYRRLAESVADLLKKSGAID